MTQTIVYTMEDVLQETTDSYNSMFIDNMDSKKRWPLKNFEDELATSGFVEAILNARIPAL